MLYIPCSDYEYVSRLSMYVSESSRVTCNPQLQNIDYKVIITVN